MFGFIKWFVFVAIAYGTLIFILTNLSRTIVDDQYELDSNGSRAFFLTHYGEDFEDLKETPIPIELPKVSEIEIHIEDRTPDKVQKKKTSPTSKTETKMNLFAALGAYPNPDPYIRKPTYHRPKYGLINDNNYCNKVDHYNLMHPQNMFDRMNFYTDFRNATLLKSQVLPKIGTLLMADVGRYQKNKEDDKKTPIDKRITTFHLAGDQFYKYHKIGTHYLCATQMFNHIPNHTNLIRKDEVLQNIEDYSLMFKDKPQCFDKSKIFPATYRFLIKDECQKFFEIINSKEFVDSMKNEPIQYLVKVGHGSHKSQGVFLLDDNKRESLNLEYDKGKKCGEVDKPLIAQKYITNPLLLDKQNKFDLRVYMLVASTNPLIVYYHDGYLRVSINTFDKFSEDRATHLTNTFVAEKKFEEARKENKTINGMNAEQLEEYHLWTFKALENYLLESGKISDKKWLNKYLRPSLKKSFIHLVRMTSAAFWKQSNVYELFGLDFMLDENMDLWFIECNPNPLLDGVKPQLITRMLTDLFEIQYAYYRSRMKRVIAVIQKMQKASKIKPITTMKKWRRLYQEAVKNRLEPEYQIQKKNTFKLIMDESLPTEKAYFGYLPKECVK